MTEEDAKRDWNEFEELLMVRSIEDDVSNESSGNRPPGGAESWNEYWLVRIEYLSKDLEKNQVYIDYIKTQRQEAGLPPLEGR